MRDEFKMWFKPDQDKLRKKNFIGDQIIVEKDVTLEQDQPKGKGAQIDST